MKRMSLYSERPEGLLDSELYAALDLAILSQKDRLRKVLLCFGLLQKSVNRLRGRFSSCLAQAVAQRKQRRANFFSQGIQVFQALPVLLRKRVRKAVRRIFPFLQPPPPVDIPHKGVIFKRSNLLRRKPPKPCFQAAEQAVALHSPANTFQR